MCKLGKHNLSGLGLNTKQNDFCALKFKSTIILYLKTRGRTFYTKIVMS